MVTDRRLRTAERGGQHLRRGRRPLGAEICTASPVVGIEQAGDRVAVRTETGVLHHADRHLHVWRLVEADRCDGRRGPADRTLRRQIAFTTPLYPRPPRVPFTIDYSSTAYFHCNDDGSGLLIGIAAKEQAVGFDTAVTTDWHDQLRAALAQFAPSLTGVQFASGWAGLYEMTPDCNALIGEAVPADSASCTRPDFPARVPARTRGGRGGPRPVPGTKPPSTYPDRCQTVPREIPNAPNSTSSDAEHSGYALPRGRTHHDDRSSRYPPRLPPPRNSSTARGSPSALRGGPHTLKADAESITANSPLTGEALFDVPASSRRRGGRDPGRAHGLPDLAQRTGTVRGGLIKRLGELLTEHKADLADLITVEVGRSTPKPWARSRR